jgi:hypothetical protein
MSVYSDDIRFLIITVVELGLGIQIWREDAHIGHLYNPNRAKSVNVFPISAMRKAILDIINHIDPPGAAPPHELEKHPLYKYVTAFVIEYMSNAPKTGDGSYQMDWKAVERWNAVRKDMNLKTKHTITSWWNDVEVKEFVRRGKYPDRNMP